MGTYFAVLVLLYHLHGGITRVVEFPVALGEDGNYARSRCEDVLARLPPTINGVPVTGACFLNHSYRL